MGVCLCVVVFLRAFMRGLALELKVSEETMLSDTEYGIYAGIRQEVLKSMHAHASNSLVHGARIYQLHISQKGPWRYTDPIGAENDRAIKSCYSWC